MRSWLNMSAVSNWSSMRRWLNLSVVPSWSGMRTGAGLNCSYAPIRWEHFWVECLSALFAAVTSGGNTWCDKSWISICQGEPSGDKLIEFGWRENRFETFKWTNTDIRMTCQAYFVYWGIQAWSLDRTANKSSFRFLTLQQFTIQVHLR